MIVVTGSCKLKVQGKSKQTKVKAKAMGHPCVWFRQGWPVSVIQMSRMDIPSSVCDKPDRAEFQK